MVTRSFSGLALCAGAGGLELGLHIAEPGYRTVCYIEQDAFAASTLVARMEDKALDQAPIWDDLKTFNGRPWRGKVDIVTAGYPCQPFSAAGRKRGTDDPRHLWPDVARIIRETQAEWVFLENVPHHLRVGFPVVAAGLRRMGYRLMAGLFSARETGASHFRKRLFILAHADGLYGGLNARDSRGPGGIAVAAARRQSPIQLGPGGRRVVNALGLGGMGADAGEKHPPNPPIYTPGPGAMQAWHQVLGHFPGLKPALLRSDDGMANRVDRSRLAGNGVCPLAAAVALCTLRASFGNR